ncbi:hypothetical protein AVEN_143323-1 [Araneus ventricosus]|uniref:Secreted protein n=1 Tax=Araneus ventricosus TaxID=182803 RepID=A0A4Y2AFI2_ARAVE|nr:hypothetical protein AVEN_143323-1 [Araneus ventricosus]
MPLPILFASEVICLAVIASFSDKLSNQLVAVIYNAMQRSSVVTLGCAFQAHRYNYSPAIPDLSQKHNLRTELPALVSCFETPFSKPSHFNNLRRTLLTNLYFANF